MKVSEVYSWRNPFSLQWLYCFFPSKWLLMVFLFVHLKALILLPDSLKTSWVIAENLQNEGVEVCSETKHCIFKKVFFQASVVKWNWLFLSHVFHYSDVLLSLLSYWYYSHSLGQAINRIIIIIFKKNNLCFDTYFKALYTNEDNFNWEETMTSSKDCCRCSNSLLLLQPVALPPSSCAFEMGSTMLPQMTHCHYSAPHVFCLWLSWLYHHRLCHNSKAPLKKLLFLWSSVFHCTQLEIVDLL